MGFRLALVVLLFRTWTEEGAESVGEPAVLSRESTWEEEMQGGGVMWWVHTHTHCNVL